MKRSTKILLLLILVSTGIIIGGIRGSAPASSQAQSSSETKENDSGEVRISVTPRVLKSGFPASFDIAFETHSIDLVFDVEDVATLTDTTGTTYIPHWEGSPPGGHHRSGTLRFTPDLKRKTTLTLTLVDIAGIPSRTFSWKEGK